ncbi:hypothetical protein ORF 197L [Red seabream iridovirus]|uniref:Uncharacterized protein n=3 Tax=Infectious spleen and kidney necrosis virus TaxID=180170 RepID=A0A3Q9EGB4_ISKNV|nr:hypothetical protein [Pompano iridovirus]QQA04031.1 hypothetical protein Geno-4000036 [Large yellow croaker iridovirus]UNA01319.1 hypothetical protein [Red seabream iridovirus]WDW25971.1 hypothetical protein FD201807_038R [Megalocytivirus FD201807]AZQ20899.1 hypothetical protein [Pompano iridovirus]
MSLCLCVFKTMSLQRYVTTVNLMRHRYKRSTEPLQDQSTFTTALDTTTAVSLAHVPPLLSDLGAAIAVCGPQKNLEGKLADLLAHDPWAFMSDNEAMERIVTQHIMNNDAIDKTRLATQAYDIEGAYDRHVGGHITAWNESMDTRHDAVTTKADDATRIHGQYATENTALDDVLASPTAYATRKPLLDRIDTLRSLVDSIRVTSALATTEQMTQAIQAFRANFKYRAPAVTPITIQHTNTASIENNSMFEITSQPYTIPTGLASVVFHAGPLSLTPLPTKVSLWISAGTTTSPRTLLAEVDQFTNSSSVIISPPLPTAALPGGSPIYLHIRYPSTSHVTKSFEMHAYHLFG